MCGVAGYFGSDDREALVERLSTCRHCAQEDVRTATPGGAALVQHRAPGDAAAEGLATSADGRFTIALARTAAARGLAAAGEDPASALLAAFAADGSAAFDRLDGAFAVAIWDARDEALTVARDHLGLAPLFVAEVPDAGEGRPRWVFAGSISTILGTGLVEARPDDRTVYRYLADGVTDEGRRTFFAGIERVEPGESVRLSASGAERSTFSGLRAELDADAPQRRHHAGHVAAEYRSRLTDALRRSLEGDVIPVTALSGGLDSSALTLLGDRILDERVTGEPQTTQQLVSVLYPESTESEARISDVVGACRQDVGTHTLTPTTDDFKKDLRDFVRAQEEPLPSSDAYTTFLLAREAAAHGDVLVDGLGADETLAGRDEDLVTWIRELRRRSPRAAASVASAARPLLRSRARRRLARRLRGHGSVPAVSLLDKAFAQAHGAGGSAGAQEPVRTLHARLADGLWAPPLAAAVRARVRSAARFGLDVRLPYLDRSVVTYALGLSGEQLVEDGRGERVLRHAVVGLVPDSVLRGRDVPAPHVPHDEWFMRLKNHVYGIFLSEPFANRDYVDQTEVLHAFEGWIKGKKDVDAMAFWRLVNLELWLEEFVDEKVEEAPQEAQPRVKTDYEPNARKDLDLTLPSGEKVRRYPLRTDLYAREDDLDSKTLGYITRFFEGLPDAGPEHAAATRGPWYFFISEKIVAITQGRSYFIWDIKVTRAARVLSRYVSRTPAGIGLGSPFTMQLAIQEAGLPRVVFAAAGGFVGKLVGRRGLFYDLVGGDIRAIDGPTEYSVYPANVSAKLAPKDPDDVAARLSAAIRASVPEAYRETFAGTVVMDANDLGRNALGKDAPGDPARYEAMFVDNPQGQGSEQTPMSIVFVLEAAEDRAAS